MGETRVLEFPIGGGLNEKVADEYLDPSANVANVVNGNFTKLGAIDKRLGLQVLPTSTLLPGSTLTPLTSALRVASWSRSALTIASTQGLYGYSAAAAGVVGIGPLPAVVPLRRPVTTTPQAQYPTLCDFPYGGSTLRLSVYLGTDYNLYATVTDADTGDVILPPTVIYKATGAFPDTPYVLQLMYLPAAPAAFQVVLTWYDNNNSTSYGCHYSPATNSFGATTAFGASGPLDIVPFLNDPAGGMIVFYVPSTSTTTCRWIYLAPNFSPVTSGLVENVSSLGVMSYPLYAYAVYGEAVWFAYSVHNPAGLGSYSQRVVALSGSGSFVQLFTPTTFYSGESPSYCTGIVRLTPTTAYVSWWAGVDPNPGVSFSAPQGKWQTLNTSGTALFGGTTPLGYLPIARPFLVGATLYQACVLCFKLQASVEPSSPHSEQGTVYLMQWSPYGATTPNLENGAVYGANAWFPCATVAPRQVDLSFTVYGIVFLGAHLPFMSALSATGTATRLAVAFKTLGEDIAGLSGAQGSAWAVDFCFDVAHQASLFQANELGSALHLSSGVPFVADGASTFEDSFFYYPEFAYVEQAGSGGGLTGTYVYAVMYVYPDAAGLLHRSSPVFTKPITLTGGQLATVYFPSYSATWRDITNPGQVYAEIYRTTSDGAVFYLVDRTPASGTSTAQLQWPLTGGDNVSDADIDVATILYTTGGVLDCVNPPAAALQIAHLGRMVLVDETLQQTWESKAFEPGEAPGFNEALITPYPDGGDITALASMDGTLVVFKADSIWLRTGFGPADTGQGSDWYGPTKIASDVGCVSMGSVVLTPMGIMFQAASGIYLLDRGNQVSFIGKPVVSLVASYPTITAAVLVPADNQVRFLAANALGQQIIIVYDYLLQQWTQHAYGVMGALIASMVLPASGQMAVLCTDGELYQEHLPTDANAYMDDTFNGAHTFVQTIITWPWVKLQVQGYQRLRRIMALCEQQDSCGLSMSLATDYDGASPVELTSWTSALLAQYPNPILRVEHHVSGAYNKQESAQVTLADTAGTAMTTGQGCRFVNLQLELDQIGTRYRRLPVGLRR